MLTQTHSSSVSIKEVVLNARKKMKNLFRNLIYIFIVLEAAGQNVAPDIIDKDQDDIVTQQKIKNYKENNDQCQVLSEEMKEMREFKDKTTEQLNNMEQSLQDLISRGKIRMSNFIK